MVGVYLKKARDKSGFDKLERREQRMVLLGIAFILCFAILQFVITPYLDSRERLQASIARQQEELLELRLMQQEYQGLKSKAGGIKEQLKQRPASFSLFSFLDRQAAQADIKGLISYMKPSTIEGDGELQESLVEMKLQAIGLEPLVTFLELIESPENVVSIKRISIQDSGKEEGGLDVIIQIMTFISVE